MLFATRVSPRLFTATDVERAARVAANYMQDGKGVESAVAHALDVLTNHHPLYYSETEVRSMIQFLLTKEDVDAELAEAIAAIGR